jgi:bifunctional DNA-binding transcriptional regulator/antitoxin component of YhaV-PrlF toxin-antitoxin module
MIATIANDGELVIPDWVCRQANLKPGDELEIGHADGLILIRKRGADTDAGIRAFLVADPGLPETASPAADSRKRERPSTDGPDAE